jgi:hypothetical protein
MEKLNYLEFAKLVDPSVIYNQRYAQITFKHFVSGFWGAGFYQLTANGRKHPQRKFKSTKAVWNDYQKNKCVIVE